MTIAPDRPIEEHAIHRDRMLEHARKMLAEGDRLQASEKIWGAAAHGIKVVADERGWPYNRHQDAGVITSYIAEQTGQLEIDTLFSAVRDMHTNFYGDRRTLKEIGIAIERAERFLSLLHEAHLAMQPDLPMPNHPEYRKRAKQDAKRMAANEGGTA